MTRNVAIAFSLLLLVNSIHADEGERIFNGKDLTGWTGDPALWSVVDGAITGKTDGKLKHNSFLIWNGTAGDFELRFKYRIEGGNSGVQYRSKVFKDVGPFAVGGYQADIDSEGKYTGILYEERGRGIVAERGQKVEVGDNGNKKVGSIGDAKALLAGIDQTKWNDYTITANGETLTHSINGRKLVEVVDRQTGKRAKDGIIALQLHVGNPMVVQFKDLQLKRAQPQAADPKAFVAPDAPPSWIWAGPGGEKHQAFLRKSFEIKSGVAVARLVLSGDDSATVFIDGKEVLSNSSWAEPEYKDVTPVFLANEKLGVGKHVIAVRARNERSKAGVLVRLAFESSGAAPFAVVSDGSWKAAQEAPAEFVQSAFDDSAWASATVIAGLGDRPFDRVTEQTLVTATRMRDPTATPAESIKLLKDFKVELLYSVPKDSQGSWVNLCHDPKGRLYVSDQYGPLYRVTPPPLGGKPEQTRIERVPAEIGEAQGLLWAFDSLYVMVNSDAKGGKYANGFYRVRDTNGDDQLDEVKLLRKLDGSGEHGPHAILLSPDGKSLTVIHGNQTKLTKLAGSRVPRHWGEDHLLPRMPDGRGFMAGVLGPGGCVYNVDPDGQNWELLSTGYRNQFDAGYNRNGDLFTYDADMEWDFNTPWYRPTRVCLVASGSDYGWRNGAGKWPPHYADTIPAAVDIGPGSPTGTCFGYGAKFPAKYQDAFFICDWTYGKLIAVHLTPHQSGYKGVAEEFAMGSPLPLTDVIINPHDGAMYFTIGGRKTKSGLYRVTYTGKESTAPATNGDDAFRADRETRRRLESFHGHPDPKAIDAAWPYLSHPDRLIRSAARTVLEHNDYRTWQRRALTETDPAKAIAALLALVRVSAKDPFHIPDRELPPRPPDAAHRGRLLDALARISWPSLNEWQRLDLLRTYQILFNRLGMPDEAQRSRTLAILDPHYPARSHQANGMLCEVLVFLESPTVAQKSLALMGTAPTQEEQLEYARSLRMLKTGWTPDLRRDYFNWFLKAGTYKGGMSFAGFLGMIKKDAMATLSNTELALYKPILEAKPESVSAESQPARPFVRKWAVRDLDSALASGLRERDYDRGRVLFGATNCFGCHRFANEGGAQGPDLTILSGRFSPRDLLESIIEPNKEISDQYESIVIQTIDGKTISGRIFNHDGNKVTLLPNMLDPSKTVSVDRRRIETQEVSKVSMMPEGLLDTLKEDEILDLMAYLLSRGERENGMFKK